MTMTMTTMMLSLVLLILLELLLGQNRLELLVVCLCHDPLARQELVDVDPQKAAEFQHDAGVWQGLARFPLGHRPVADPQPLGEGGLGHAPLLPAGCDELADFRLIHVGHLLSQPTIAPRPSERHEPLVDIAGLNRWLSPGSRSRQPLPGGIILPRKAFRSRARGGRSVMPGQSSVVERGARGAATDARRSCRHRPHNGLPGLARLDLPDLQV